MLVLTGLLAFFLMLSMPLSEASAEEEVAVIVSANGETAYSRFSDALSAWENGTTLRLSASVSCDATVEVSGEKSLDLNGFTLSSLRGRTLAVRGTLTVLNGASSGDGAISGGGVRIYSGALIMNGGSLRNNTGTDGGGVYVESGAAFTMNGGTIANNSAEEGNGGGVYVAVGGTFTMSGGSIVENRAHRGGGVYCGGNITLGGIASIENNTAENLYLCDGVIARAEDASGRIGITCESGAAAFANGNATRFFADSATFAVRNSGESYRLALSPLTELSVSLDGGVSVYPTTEIESLTSRLSYSGINENGVSYPFDAIKRVELSFADGRESLLVGTNTLVVKAFGEEGEEVTANIEVRVIAPVLREMTAQFTEEEPIYFDTPLEELSRFLCVEGRYSDGLVRTICTSGEETAELNGENYITDFYTVSGNLGDHTDGVALLTVYVKNQSAQVNIAVSRYVLNTAELTVQDVVTVAGDEAWTLDADAFFEETLPDGIEAYATLDNGLQASGLAAGTYGVRIGFRVLDGKNYVVEGGTLTANLIVNYAFVTLKNGDAELCVIEREGGIPLSWSLGGEDVTGKQLSPRLEGDWEAQKVIELSLRDNGAIQSQFDGGITVRLLLDGKLLTQEVKLYRILSDGSAVEVTAEREDDYFVFRALSAGKYVVAADSGFGVYLVLTIVFGVVCLLGAGALIWYFIKRKHLSLR